MLATRIFSFVAFGLTALVSTTQASPINVGLKTRASTADSALVIVKQWSANVNSTVPKLTALDQAGKDTGPAFEALYTLYDKVTADISALKPDNSTESPVHYEIAKTISNTFTTVNSAINRLRPIALNVNYAQGIVKREAALLPTIKFYILIVFQLLNGDYQLVWVKVELQIRAKRTIS